jgi:hypothetical protein
MPDGHLRHLQYSLVAAAGVIMACMLHASACTWNSGGCTGCVTLLVCEQRAARLRYGWCMMVSFPFPAC